jgi:hypothetical protein
MTDEELAKFLGIHNDERWPRAIAKLAPEKRATYERMAGVAVEAELWTAGLGPKPAGVLIDTERRRGWR